MTELPYFAPLRGSHIKHTVRMLNILRKKVEEFYGVVCGVRGGVLFANTVALCECSQHRGQIAWLVAPPATCVCVREMYVCMHIYAHTAYVYAYTYTLRQPATRECV
jgi:hypothetical protein